MNHIFENKSEVSDIFFSNLWSYNDIIAALNLISVNSDELFYNGFSIDSRKVGRNQVFIALHGKNFNGHDFIDEAFNSGASLAIVDEENCSSLIGKSYILVDDTKIALHKIAKYAAKKSEATLLGITGSCGKTTVKSWVAELLSNFGETVSSVFNYNNEIGLPISMTNLKPETKYGVFEIGINHPNEMTKLSNILMPDVALMLKISNAHIGHFSSLKELMDEKSKIIDGLKESGKFIVDYCNVEKFSSIIQNAYLKNAEIVMISEKPFSTISKSYAFIKEIFYDKQRSLSKVSAVISGLPIEYFVSFQNSKLIYSTFISFITALVTLFKDETLEKIVEKRNKDIDSLIFKISQLKPLAGRGEVNTLSKCGFYFKLIDDAYNANLESMICAIETINKFETIGKKISVIGGMVELGDNSFSDHQKLCEELNNSKIDKIILVGEIFKNYEEKFKNKEVIFFNSKNEISENFWDIINENDVILVKGSNSTNLHELVLQLKTKYSKIKIEKKVSGMVA